MKKISCNFLIIIGLIMALGTISTVSAAGTDDPPKRPKNTGILSVKTAPQAYPILVDGVQVGLSGVSYAAEYYLTPGTHRVEIQVPNTSSPYVRDLEIKKDARNCICIKIVERTIETPCPYRVNVSGPEVVQEGDLIQFVATDAVNKTPVSYVWTVPPDVRITSGQGTSSITVDSTGLGGKNITAEVDVSDGTYDAQCRQRLTVRTFVKPPPPIDTPPPPTYVFFGNLIFRAFDADKQILDGYTIDLQNRPDAQAYVIVYQGRAPRSQSADKMARRSIDYLVKTRGIDPRRIMVTSGGSRETTQADMFIVPPGAQQPVPSPR